MNIVLLAAIGIGTVAFVAHPVGHAIKKAAVKTEHAIAAPVKFAGKLIHHPKD